MKGNGICFVNQTRNLKIFHQYHINIIKNSGMGCLETGLVLLQLHLKTKNLDRLYKLERLQKKLKLESYLAWVKYYNENGLPSDIPTTPN